MNEYIAIYDKAENSFSAFVPDLPGCIAAGDAFEEKERLIQESIQFYIDVLRAAGQPIPVPTTRAKAVSVSA